MFALKFEHLGHGELPVFRVRRLGPHRPAAFAQPGVELGKRAKAPLLSLQPDAPAAVLHVLLHHPFLPARGDVAEVGIKQVVAAHGIEARVDDAAFALLDLVHRRLHVVVNAPVGHTAQSGKAAGVGIEQHLVALAGVGHQPEGAAGTQLEVRDLHVVVDAAHQQSFLAPVELEGLAELKAHRHEGFAGRLTLLLAPVTDEIGQPAVAAPVALGLQLGQQRPGCAPGMFGAPRIGFESLHQRCLECP